MHCPWACNGGLTAGILGYAAADSGYLRNPNPPIAAPRGRPVPPRASVPSNAHKPVTFANARRLKARLW